MRPSTLTACGAQLPQKCHKTGTNCTYYSRKYRTRFRDTPEYTAETGWIDQAKIRKYCYPPADDTLVMVCGRPAICNMLCGPRTRDGILAPFKYGVGIRLLKSYAGSPT